MKEFGFEFIPPNQIGLRLIHVSNLRVPDPKNTPNELKKWKCRARKQPLARGWSEDLWIKRRVENSAERLLSLLISLTCRKFLLQQLIYIQSRFIIMFRSSTPGDVFEIQPRAALAVTRGHNPLPYQLVSEAVWWSVCAYSCIKWIRLSAKKKATKVTWL